MMRLLKDCILWALSLLDRICFWKSSVVFFPRIPIGVGGPRSFLTLLSERLNEAGWRVTHNKFSKCDCALIPIECDEKLLRSFHKKGVRIIQRLDGLFYDHKTGLFDRVRSQGIPELFKDYADTIVFQSEYSRNQCEHFLGPSQAPHQVVVYNGTDLNCFYPREEKRQQNDPWVFVSTGNFRDKSMIFPILDALEILCNNGVHFEWKIIGPIVNPTWEQVLLKPYIKLLGPMDRETIAEELRSSDIFLFSFLNPNCPNSVIEATVSGLPVVSFSSGSMSELCDFNRELLAIVSDQVIHRESQLLSELFLEKIVLATQEYDRFRENTIENLTRFDIKQTVSEYLKVLQIKHES